MPFAWTAIHLIDIINGVSHFDPVTAPATEKESGVSSASQRKVRNQAKKYILDNKLPSLILIT
jgi:hypothetical protein